MKICSYSRWNSLITVQNTSHPLGICKGTLNKRPFHEICKFHKSTLVALDRLWASIYMGCKKPWLTHQRSFQRLPTMFFYKQIFPQENVRKIIMQNRFVVLFLEW